MLPQVFFRVVIWGAVAVVAASTALAWRQRPRPGATAFAVTMLAATWWVACTSLGLTTTDPAIRLLWVKVEWAGVAFVPVAWLAFALSYTGRSEYVTPRSMALASALPVVTLVLGLTNGAGHNLLLRDLQFEAYGSLSLLHRSFGPWFWVHTAYSYLLLGAGALLVVRVVASRRLLYRGQATALLLVVLVPWSANALYVAGYSPVPSFDPTPYAFVVSGAAGLSALTQLRFLDAVPVTNRVAREAVVSNVDAGVIVLDTDDRVVDINPTAESVVEGAADAVLGSRIGKVLPTDEAPDRVADADGTVLTVEEADGVSACEVQVTDITDASNNVTGRVVLLQDVTERRTRVQRLDVLNRVLRHNLRNEMNVVYGFADRLRAPDPDVESIADDIQAKAQDLVELSEKARQMDAILEASDDDREPADLRQVVEIERDRLADERPEVTVETHLPEGSVFADQVAGTVVRNLVENAVEHTPSESPWIGIAVSTDPGAAGRFGCPDVATEESSADAAESADRVFVTVADEGPGIPASERGPIDTGVESQLDHASGIGLWLVRWALLTVGGDLHFADRDPTGSCVTVELPRADGGEASP